MRVPSDSESLRFLEALFAGCSYPVEFRPLPPKVNSLFSRDFGKAERFRAECQTRGVGLFFGVATREDGGTKGHCREIPAVWTDIDFKDQPETEAEEKLSGFQLQPSAIVGSGGGLHCYWFLKSPADAQLEGERVENLLRQLAERLGGDRGACDFSRVLRLPGTLNLKYDPPRECRIREINRDRRYDLAELESSVPAKPALALPGLGTVSAGEDNVPEGRRNRTLTQLVGKKFAEGWSPDDIRRWASGWNHEQCRPPLPEDEVRTTVESIRKTHERNHPGRVRRYGDFSELPSIWDQTAELEWDVDGLIASGSVTLCCAESGTGKTWFALGIAGAVAHGRAFAGRAVRQKKVLYLDNENPLFTIKERLSALGIEPTPELKIWGGWVDSPVPGPQNPFTIHFAREYGGLIVVDPLVAFHTGSEQDSTDTRAFMQHMRRLANLGASVLVIHHAGKAQTAKLYRGSSDIKASVDMAYSLQAVPENADRLEELAVRCFKSRLAQGQSFGLRFQAGVGFGPSSCSAGSLTTSSHEIIEDILANRPGSNQKEVVELARQKGLSKHQAEAALKSGPWHRERGRGKEIRYSLEAELERLEI